MTSPDSQGFLGEQASGDGASRVRARMQSQLAEVAAEASAEGDRAALSEIVYYLADDLPALVDVVSLALEMARQQPDSDSQPPHRP